MSPGGFTFTLYLLVCDADVLCSVVNNWAVVMDLVTGLESGCYRCSWSLVVVPAQSELLQLTLNHLSSPFPSGLKAPFSTQIVFFTGFFLRCLHNHDITNVCLTFRNNFIFLLVQTIIYLNMLLDVFLLEIQTASVVPVFQ